MGKVAFVTGAREEFLAEVGYYNKAQAGLGARFADAIEKAAALALVFPDVGMPHVLWELQGVRTAKMIEEKDPHDESKVVHKFAGFEKVTDGKMTALEYDNAVTDLVAYLQWMGEPAQSTRKRMGVIVVMFLALLSLLAWRLNASYWKEVK